MQEGKLPDCWVFDRLINLSLANTENKFSDWILYINFEGSERFRTKYYGSFVSKTAVHLCTYIAVYRVFRDAIPDKLFPAIIAWHLRISHFCESFENGCQCISQISDLKDLHRLASNVEGNTKNLATCPQKWQRKLSSATCQQILISLHLAVVEKIRKRGRGKICKSHAKLANLSKVVTTFLNLKSMRSATSVNNSMGV